MPKCSLSKPCHISELMISSWSRFRVNDFKRVWPAVLFKRCQSRACIRCTSPCPRWATSAARAALCARMVSALPSSPARRRQGRRAWTPKGTVWRFHRQAAAWSSSRAQTRTSCPSSTEAVAATNLLAATAIKCAQTKNKTNQNHNGRFHWQVGLCGESGSKTPLMHRPVVPHPLVERLVLHLCSVSNVGEHLFRHIVQWAAKVRCARSVVCCPAFVLLRALRVCHRCCFGCVCVLVLCPFDSSSGVLHVHY